MKLKRCENQHLYPADEYDVCPYCTESAAAGAGGSPPSSEVSYEIESAGPSVYNDRIITKKDKEEMRARANREYNETRQLHVNTRAENFKNGASSFFDNIFLVWDAIATTPVGRFIAFIGELLAQGDDCD